MALAKQIRTVEPNKGKLTGSPYSFGDVSRALTRKPQVEDTLNRKPKQNCRRITTSAARTVSLTVIIARAVNSAIRKSCWSQACPVPIRHGNDSPGGLKTIVGRYRYGSRNRK